MMDMDAIDIWIKIWMSPPLDYLNAQTLSNKVAYITAKMGMSLATCGWSEEFKRYEIGVNSLWPRIPIASCSC